MIAATNKNLEEEIAAGRFREDLYYRLNVIPLHVPSLRERREDVPILARAFVAEFCADSGASPEQLSQRAMIGPAGPLLARQRARAAQPDGAAGDHDAGRRHRRRRPARRPRGRRSQRCAAPPLTLDEARRTFEREYLIARLREHSWNISRTAEAIGIARESLSRKVKALGIEIERG